MPSRFHLLLTTILEPIRKGVQQPCRCVFREKHLVLHRSIFDGFPRPWPHRPLVLLNRSVKAVHAVLDDLLRQLETVEQRYIDAFSAGRTTDDLAAVDKSSYVR